MSEWTFAQGESSDELAQLQFFSVKKHQQNQEIEFVITVHEYANPRNGAMRFFAQADKQTNQKTCPYTPCGWGSTLLKALAECVEAVRRFPYTRGRTHDSAAEVKL